MEAKLYLFAIRVNDENAPYSHLTLCDSVAGVYKKFNDDLSYLLTDENDKLNIKNIISYFKTCSLWCLGSIDFITGELIPHLEQYDNLIDELEVLQHE